MLREDLDSRTDPYSRVNEMGDTDSFYSESNESLIDEIFGTLSRNRSLKRDEVKGKRSSGLINRRWTKIIRVILMTACNNQEFMDKIKFKTGKV